MRQTLKEKVTARLAELKRNPFEASRQGGLERSFINDILNGKKTSVRGDNLAKLASSLDWTISDLISVTDAPAVSESDGAPLLYKKALGDNDRIQVSVGALRTSVLHTLLRGKVAEQRAEALSHVLVAMLSTLPDVAVVMPIREQVGSSIGFPRQEPDDPM